MSKNSFILFKSFYEPIKNLSDEDLGKLFRLIFEYQLEEKPKDPKKPTGFLGSFDEKLSPQIVMAFSFFKNQFEIDRQKYQKVIDRNQANGTKGGRPKKSSEKNETQNNPKNPVGLRKPKKADNDNDIYINSSLCSELNISTTKLQSWIKHLKTKTSKITSDRIELQLKKLKTLTKETSQSAESLIDLAIERGWQSFYPEKNQKMRNDFDSNLSVRYLDASKLEEDE